MTDFFVLFDQPRKPWLDAETLKKKYHELTRVAHPDLQTRAPDVKFEEVNEAYRVLSDPKLRTQYLLTLEGHSSTALDRVLPEDLQELFLQIGSLSQKVKLLLAHIGAESSALTLSLLKSNLLQARSEVGDLLKQLTHLYDNCLTGLEKLSEAWDQNRGQNAPRLQALHDRMAYLSRWMTQLKEMEFQLSGCG